MALTPIATTHGAAVTVMHEVDAVHVQVGGDAPWTFEPADAAALGDRLREEAQNAIHAERIRRR